MLDTTHCPLLFLDVDGPLLPFGPGRESSPLPSDSNPLLDRLDPGLGPLLLALRCELVWATTWMHDANRAIGASLGLPVLPVLQWPDADDDRVDAWFGLHWKTRPVVERAAGRPFLWIDDEITDNDRDWVAAHHPGRALLHRVDPRLGLRPSDFPRFAAWLDARV
ncbi:hypothetical protein NDR87_35735 [Nocardia sp. CDC159]|uniref:Secreted protein n=1 Tax=Nocardia pulmonis TaxID=2951408 RepID=A0A9X2J1F9_9NOCA|nr:MULTISPECIES: HAD domain-containing protein [Nocardia]MCM6778839.1 hypothetical protein [Nocardia pulmonis]MCM6791728.1 hypothetical protein [Nocardia sp. CDC159]